MRFHRAAVVLQKHDMIFLGFSSENPVHSKALEYKQTQANAFKRI